MYIASIENVKLAFISSLSVLCGRLVQLSRAPVERKLERRFNNRFLSLTIRPFCNNGHRPIIPQRNPTRICLHDDLHRVSNNGKH